MAVQNTRKDPVYADGNTRLSGARSSDRASGATAGSSSSGSKTSKATPPGNPARRSPGPKRPPVAASGEAATAAGSGVRCSGPSRSPYRYLVLPGNESVLLREALQRRPWWEPAAEPAAAGGSSAGSKAGGDTAQRWNLWAGLNGQRFTHFDLLPSQSQQQEKLRASRRLVNRLQEHGVICTKSGLAKLLAGIQQAAADGAGALDFSWIPETYVVPAGPAAGGSSGGGTGGPLANFQAAYTHHAAEGRTVWIAKPTSLNRGNGIEVFDSLERIMQHLRSRPSGSSLILQKYIERPLLLGGRKFDIRAYVLVGPDGSVWFHKEAYCRTSSTPYDASDLTNRSAHLTNDAVQKHLDSYNAYEDHCKLSLEDLGPALRRSDTAAVVEGAAVPPGGEKGSSLASASTITAVLTSLDTSPGSEEGLWGAMRRCVVVLFSAAVPLLNPRRLAHCFELLGLDFMLDEDGRVYLIEVNTSPALFRAGAYLADLLPRLVEEVVQKVVDPLFPPPQQQDPRQQCTAQGASDLDQAVSGTADGTQGDGAGAPPGGEGPGQSGTPSPSASYTSPSATASAVAADIVQLNGFVRIQLDERLGTAAVAAMGSGAADRGHIRRAASGGRGAAGSGSGPGVTKAVPVRTMPGPGAGSGTGRGAVAAARTAPRYRSPGR